MAKPNRAETTKSGRTGIWIARDAKSGRFIEMKSSRTSSLLESTVTKADGVAERRPGRFKGVLTVGPEFFEPLSTVELAEFDGV